MARQQASSPKLTAFWYKLIRAHDNRRREQNPLRARLFSLFLALTLTALAADGAAQTPRTSRPFSVVTAEWNRVLDGAEQYLRGPERGRERVLQYREQVQRIRDEATVRKQQAEQELANTR